MVRILLRWVLMNCVVLVSRLMLMFLMCWFWKVWLMFVIILVVLCWIKFVLLLFVVGSCLFSVEVCDNLILYLVGLGDMWSVVLVFCIFYFCSWWCFVSYVFGNDGCLVYVSCWSFLLYFGKYFDDWVLWIMLL